MQVQSLGQEDPLEKGMATHSSILAWRNPMDQGAWWATVRRVESGRASELPTIEKGTKEWDEAVKSIANGGNTSYRTKTATEAKELLNEARGNMNRYKQYTSKQYKKGYEMHPNEINTRNAPHNDLPHVKWKDWLDELHSGKGHIFFDKPN